MKSAAIAAQTNVSPSPSMDDVVIADAAMALSVLSFVRDCAVGTAAVAAAVVPPALTIDFDATAAIHVAAVAAAVPSIDHAATH